MAAFVIDPEKRRNAFERLRREQVVEESKLTPEERILAADELLRIARTLRPEGEPETPPGRPRRGG